MGVAAGACVEVVNGVGVGTSVRTGVTVVVKAVEQATSCKARQIGSSLRKSERSIAF